VLRARSSERNAGAGAGIVDYYREVHTRLSNDPDFRAFYSGESIRPPSFYLNQTKKSLGPFFDHLPDKVISYLNSGEPLPNPRISLAASSVAAGGGPGVVNIQSA